MKPLRLTALAAIAAAALSLPAQPVDRAEVESVKNRKIEFVNYVGPHAVVNTVAQIYGVGEELGALIARGAARAGTAERFSVIHAADPAVLTGFDADILVLGKDTGVDHVKNLRRIVSGYLSKAYGYSRADADLLAEFITVYNAVYRGAMDYLSSRYKPVVMGHLAKDNAGLSLRWDEWPGRTRIVIPLGAKAGQGRLGSVDTGPLTEATVVDKLRETPDMGVEPRRDMVDLKEREVAQAEADVAVDRERLAVAEREVAREREGIAAEERAIEAEKERLAAAAGPAETAAVVERAKDEEALAAREADLAARRDEAAAAERAAAAAAENIRRDEAAAAARRDEAAAERAAIAADQQAAIRAETGATGQDAGPVATGTFLEALSLTLPLSRLVSLNLSTGGTVKQSELNTIRGRTLVEQGGAYFCVAGSAEGGRAVRLVSVNASTLAVQAEGKDDIFFDSFLILKDGSLYAVVSKGGSFYLGRFGADLSLKALSADAIHPYSALLFREEGAAVQLARGGFAFLDPADLKARKTLR